MYLLDWDLTGELRESHLQMTFPRTTWDHDPNFHHDVVEMVVIIRMIALHVLKQIGVL
jgi:hypothetical protein